jgi:FtsZ-binding cell division protein ZapB
LHLFLQRKNLHLQQKKKQHQKRLQSLLLRLKNRLQ